MTVRALPNFFDDGSPFLQHPLLTNDRTRQEVDQLIALLDLSPTDFILDVGCGFGRHSIELAQRGYTVVGIDSAHAMIRAAKSRAVEAGVDIDLRVADGRSFQSEVPFAAILCLFTTLGQYNEHGDNANMLANLRGLLQPGGQLLIESPQRDMAVRMLVGHDRFEQPDGYTEVHRVYDVKEHTVSESFEVVDSSRTQQFHLRYRLYSVEELVGHAIKADFTDCTVFADLAGAPLTSESPTMVVRCVR